MIIACDYNDQEFSLIVPVVSANHAFFFQTAFLIISNTSYIIALWYSIIVQNYSSNYLDLLS